MSEPGTSLDPRETSVSTPPPTRYQDYLRRSDPNEWFATAQLYSDLRFQGESNKLPRFDSCRSHSFFVRHLETQELRVRTNACRLRWCPLCAKSKSRYQKLAVMQWCKTRKGLKLLTLTLRHSKAPLSHQLKHLYRCFKVFRKHRYITRSIRGAIWFTQVKLAKSDDLWHPHIHMIIDSPFLPQKRLVKIWSRITRTSKIVDLRAIKTPKYAVQYVGRYAARPAQLAVLPRARRVELAMALHGIRLAGTWGTAHQIKLTPPPVKDTENWEPLGSWLAVTSAIATSYVAKTIFESWQNGTSYMGEPLEPELVKLWARLRASPEFEPILT